MLKEVPQKKIPHWNTTLISKLIENNEYSNSRPFEIKHVENVNWDFQLKEDADAEDLLLHRLDVQSNVFPSLPKEVFEKAFALYKNASGEIKLETVNHSHLKLILKDVIDINNKCNFRKLQREPPSS